MLDSDRESHRRDRVDHRKHERTLSVALEVFPAERLVAISRSMEARAIAKSLGAHALEETDDSDLNVALTTASQFADDAGAEGILSLSCDLPLLAADDLRAMLHNASNGGVAIARDRVRVGTNAMLVAPAGLIPYRFGRESFAAHDKDANETGKLVTIVDRPGLAFDIDTSVDFENWRAQLTSLVD